MSDHRRIRLGMVGGGPGSFIGAVHRMAARLDDEFELVAAALSSDPQKAAEGGRQLHLPTERCYADWREMARAEAQRSDGIDAVVIVTPNHLHHPVAKAFLEAGTHVICDKPLATSLAQADELVALAQQQQRLFMVTYVYSGYPMVRQAQALVAAGALGDIRIVQVEYAQEWLADAIEHTGQTQAVWRSDPQRAGPAGALGDIGTHAFHLAGFVSGLAVDTLAADLHTFVAGRVLDDHAQVMLRFEGGARGMLWASQVAVGSHNALRLRVYGTEASLSFDQEHPEQLNFTRKGQPTQCLQRGAGPLTLGSRLPPGHPEGFIEAFGQLYRDFAAAWRGLGAGSDGGAGITPGPMPDVHAGRDGLAFVDAALRSHAAGGAWMAPLPRAR